MGQRIKRAELDYLIVYQYDLLMNCPALVDNYTKGFQSVEGPCPLRRVHSSVMLWGARNAPNYDSLFYLGSEQVAVRGNSLRREESREDGDRSFCRSQVLHAHGLKAGLSDQ